MRSRAHVVNVLLLGTCAILEWSVYADLLADRTLPLSAVAGLVGAFFYGIVWGVERHPSVLNLPNQDAYEALSETDQHEVIAWWVGPFFYWSAAVWMAVSVLLVGMPSVEGVGEGPTIVVTYASLIVASIADGGLAIYFLLLRAPQKVVSLRQSAQAKTG